jgi:predicted Zn-dependent protease
MAKGNQITGFFGGHNGSQAGNAKHIPFFGATRLNHRQGVRLHGNAARCDGDTVGGWFAANVHHMGLALAVKMGEMRHVLFNFGHNVCVDGFGPMGFWMHHSVMCTSHVLSNLAEASTPPQRRRTPTACLALLLSLSLTPSQNAFAQAKMSTASRSIAHLDVGEQGEFSLATERQMGNRVAKELFQDPDYIDDPLVNEMLALIWQDLLDAAERTGQLSAEMKEAFAWRIFVGRDRAINAFALPGGYLGLNLGLVAMTTTPDELASVLAHELSHVTQRHISRGTVQQARRAPAILAAMLLGAVAARKSDAMGQAAVAGSQALGLQLQLNYSRDMEREADRVGFQVLQAAGFAPQGFASMFEKLQNANRHTDNNQFPYLRTHPLNTERIGEMQARLLQGGDATSHAAPTSAQTPSIHLPGKLPALSEGPTQAASSSGARISPLAYTLLAARAKSLSAVEWSSLRSWATEVNASGFTALPIERQVGSLVIARHYFTKTGQALQAEAATSRLLPLGQADPQARRLILWMLAETAWAGGDARAAKALLLTRPMRRPELLLGAQAALSQRDAVSALDPLQIWVAAHADDAAAWHLLARAYEMQGKGLRQLRALAEAQAAEGDLRGAQDRLRAAKEIRPSGPDAIDQEIDMSIINARLQSISNQLTFELSK